MEAILFLSHIISPSIYWLFRRLSRVDPERYDTVWLYEESDGPPPWPVCTEQYYTFSEDKLIDKGYPFFPTNSLIPGNNHFPVIDFGQEYGKYEYYWIIEYDVRFTGSWELLLNEFRDSGSDFLTSCISRYPNAKGFTNWDWISHPNYEYKREDRLRSFNPIYRISNSALEYIKNSHQNGWKGHHEILIPTLLYNNGFTIEDFGGDGEFVPNKRVNEWYTSWGLNTPGVPDNGTHRYRPRFWRAGNKKNMIYHPVKPISWFARRKLSYIMDFKRFLNPLYISGKLREKLI